MNTLKLFLSVIMISLLIQSCVYTDSDCHYETFCVYEDRCNHICDRYGVCYTSGCWQYQTGCHEEWVCYD